MSAEVALDAQTDAARDTGPYSGDWACIYSCCAVFHTAGFVVDCVRYDIACFRRQRRHARDARRVSTPTTSHIRLIQANEVGKGDTSDPAVIAELQASHGFDNGRG